MCLTCCGVLREASTTPDRHMSGCRWTQCFSFLYRWYNSRRYNGFFTLEHASSFFRENKQKKYKGIMFQTPDPFKYAHKHQQDFKTNTVYHIIVSIILCHLCFLHKELVWLLGIILSGRSTVNLQSSTGFCVLLCRKVVAEHPEEVEDFDTKLSLWDMTYFALLNFATL